jgi:hypothetical protein
MFTLSAVFALGLAAATAVATPEGPQIIFPEGHGCGEVNVFYT